LRGRKKKLMKAKRAKRNLKLEKEGSHYSEKDSLKLPALHQKW